MNELVLVPQLFESRIDKQRCEVNLAALAGAEHAEQRVVAQILFFITKIWKIIRGYIFGYAPYLCYLCYLCDFFIDQSENSSAIFWRLLDYCLSLQRQIVDIMSYTKETLVINNPSEKLLKAIEELRRKKLERLEKLRNMKPEEFNRRVILT